MKQVPTADLTHATPLAGRGRRTRHTMLLIRTRGLLLAEATRYFPSDSDRETARRLRDALKTYSNGRWRRDCNAETCPPQYAGSYRLLFWAILKLHDHVPSERLIRYVLARSDR
jgi:hypothetical protein